MTSNPSLGNKAASGAVWASVDRFSAMGLQFAVNLILARLLLPSDFGAIGLIAIFIAVSQTLLDGGFGAALIQKKDPTQTDYSTIFFWNLALSLFLYAILFAAAPLIARFYSMPILKNVLRALGLILIVNAVTIIQTNRLRKQLAFKQIAATNILSYLFGAIVAVTMAFNGYGVWSLVALQLLSGGITIVVLWILTRWHPSLCFSKSSFKELFSFGGYLLAAGLLQTICQNVQGLIIGRKFSATQMGYFSQAQKLDQVSSYSIPQVIVQVMFPVYSALQDNRKKLCDTVEMNMSVIAYAIFPLMAILILVAEPLITLLYGEKWLPSVPYFQILCVGGIFVCLQNINFYAVASVGRSRELFLWSFYKWGFLLTALLVGMNFGMEGLLWGMVVSSFNIFMTNAYLSGRYVGLSVMRQLKAIAPILLLTIGCFSITFATQYYFNVKFYFAIMIFIANYLLIAFASRLKAQKEAFLMMTKIINR